MRIIRLRRYALLLPAIACVVALPISGQQSENYRMERVAVVRGAASATSMTYAMRNVVAQESPHGIGSSCGARLVNGLGFWSLLGVHPAPIILTVEHGPGGPGTVALSWSGVEDSFRVFRDVAPDQLLDPINLIQEIAACGVADADAPVAEITFYRVVAGASAPAAPLQQERP